MNTGKKRFLKAILLVFGALFLAGCFHNKNAANSNINTNINTNVEPSVQKTESKLEITDLSEGTGAEAKAGDKLTVHYIGTLLDGTKFDSSVDKNLPFTFELGKGIVIPGWEQGIPGMKVGGKRKLVIPPELAYGANSVGLIPANSILIFEVELLKIE